MHAFIAFISLLVVLGMAGAFVLWLLTWTGIYKEAKDRPPRGFEVKPITGETPVPLDRKETNNG